MDNNCYRLGLDVGSTTAKIVILDPRGEVAFCDYRRHQADIDGVVSGLLHDAAALSGRPGGGGNGDGVGRNGYCGTFRGTVRTRGNRRRPIRKAAGTRHSDHHRHRRRRCENRLSARRRTGRPAHERQLCRRNGRIHRPDGPAARHGDRRARYAGRTGDPYTPHRFAVRRLLQNRRTEPYQQERPENRHRRIHLPRRSGTDRHDPLPRLRTETGHPLLRRPANLHPRPEAGLHQPPRTSRRGFPRTRPGQSHPRMGRRTALRRKRPDGNSRNSYRGRRPERPRSPQRRVCRASSPPQRHTVHG